MKAMIGKLDQYILIAHPANGSRADSPTAAFKDAMLAAHRADDEVEWLAQFELGPKDFTAVFKAPSQLAADRAAALVGVVGEMQTYVLPLTTPWSSREDTTAAAR